MERTFSFGVPDGLSTLSVPRNMSAINRRLVSSNRNYRVSLKFSPQSSTADGLCLVASAPNAWVTSSLWRHGEQLREIFYDAVGVMMREHGPDESEEDFIEKMTSFPFRLFTENPYDEFRPYLDLAHWNAEDSAGSPTYGDEAPEIYADGSGTAVGEWDYSTVGLFGNELTDGSTLDFDEANIVLLSDHLTNADGRYLVIGCVESWLQNTNAPASALEQVPVLDPDADNPALMLQRGTIEESIEDSMTLITESNVTRPYELDTVYDTLVVRGQVNMDPSHLNYLSVPQFDAVGGLLRFSNNTGSTVRCILTVHDL